MNRFQPHVRPIERVKAVVRHKLGAERMAAFREEHKPEAPWIWTPSKTIVPVRRPTWIERGWPVPKQQMAFGDLGTKHAFVDASSSPNVLAVPGGVTAGDLVIIGVQDANDAALTSVASSQGGTPTPLSTNALPAFLYWQIAPSTGAYTATVTSVDSTRIQLAAFSGPFDASPLDITMTAGAGTASGLVSTGSSGTLSQADELAIAFVATFGGGQPFTEGSGYTPVDDDATARMAFGYKIVSATTAIVADYTLGSSGTYRILGATFKKDTGGAGQPTGRRHSNSIGRERQHLRPTEIGRDRSIMNRKRSTIVVPELPASLRKAA